MIEQYLIRDYGVIEDERYLINKDGIEDYFRDEAYDLFDCGQGYYEDAIDVICYVDDKFYKVHIEAEIGSAKQDRGDRLYWVDGINSVTYTEIEKPQPKPREEFQYRILATKEEKILLEKFMFDKNICWKVSK